MKTNKWCLGLYALICASTSTANADPSVSLGRFCESVRVISAARLESSVAEQVIDRVCVSTSVSSNRPGAQKNCKKWGGVRAALVKQAKAAAGVYKKNDLADFNKDNRVGSDDEAMINSCFGQSTACCPECDIDRDGDIDLSDLGWFADFLGCAEGLRALSCQ